MTRDVDVIQDVFEYTEHRSPSDDEYWDVES